MAPSCMKDCYSIFVPHKLGFDMQMAPRKYMSPMQQQQMLRMMLVRQQAMLSAGYIQRRPRQQMWGSFR